MEESEEAAWPAAGQEREETGIIKEAETTRSPSLNDLQDRQQVFIHQQGERIATWLLQCWEGREAQQLRSVCRDYGIAKGIEREAATCKPLQLALIECEGKISPQRRYCKPARQVDHHRRSYPISEGVDGGGGGLQ